MSSKHRSTDGGEIDLDDELPSDAHFVGVDGDGASHYYSRRHHVAWVVEGGDVSRNELDPTPIEGPGDWARLVYSARGEWQDLRIGLDDPAEQAAIVDDETRVLDAAVRRVRGLVYMEGDDVEAAIETAVDEADVPVDSEEIRRAYARRHGKEGQ